MKGWSWLWVIALIAGACAEGEADPASNEGPHDTRPLSVAVDPDHEHIHDDPTNWLCLPGMNDAVCTTELDATLVRADGSTELEPHTVAREPEFDCFYLYPTISVDDGPNSDLSAGSEETNITRWQAARYSRVCRVFAPMYRQLTLDALFTGSVAEEARALPYDDALAAFNRYLTHFNEGRGFVLIGHSQGAGILARLIASEIDGRAELRERLIAAHLIGIPISVPEGEVVGGSFQHVPLCESDDQAGCAVAYSSFLAQTPPEEPSRFGRAASGRAGCVNPAAPGGGRRALTPYFATNHGAFAEEGPEITTPFITFPDFLEAECVESGPYTYLQLSVLSDPEDPRIDEINGNLGSGWGLHPVDIHIAMGTLVELARTQAAGWAATSGARRP